MQVCEVMTANVECVNPSATLVDAARKLRKLDVGSLPVCGDGNQVVGLVTDRDIVVRAVADGRSMHETKVRDIMTTHVECCFDDQAVEHAAQIMRDKQIRRLIVLDRDMHLAGIVSLGDLAVDTDEDIAGHALEGISQPAGAHW